MAVLNSFISYVVIAAALALVAIGGFFIGKSLRKKKDIKNQQSAE